MDSAMESMWVGCFERTSYLVAIFYNAFNITKIKPQLIPNGSSTLPKVAENSEANAGEDGDIDTMDEESAALDGKWIIINDEGGE